MKNFKEYIEELGRTLSPYYTPPATSAGYDLNHIFEMLALGKRIQAIPKYASLDLEEYEATVWLHNSDRSDDLKQWLRFPKEKWKENWKSYMGGLLDGSPFTEETCCKILDTVLQHSKKDDEPGDSVLLSALRIADKVVRFGPLGMMGQPASRGKDKMFYDPENPFEYGSMEESQLHAVINDYFRVLEWYGMLPCDEARALIKPEYLKAQISYLRILGEQIAEWTGKENRIEDCIKKALGSYYFYVVNF